MKSVFLFALGLVVAAGVKASDPLTLVSSDPFTNTTSQHKAEVEPHTFAFGSTIVSGFQVGRFFNGGASDIGWTTSNDNGKTWDRGFLPGITKFEGSGSFDRVSDASTAYDDAHKVWMISSLPLMGETGNPSTSVVLVSRSTDNGHHWDNPIVVTEGDSPDKNWTVCDNNKTSPYYGHCYTEWDDGSNTIYMNTSTDGGLTWSASAQISGSAGVGGQPVVQPDGHVIVPIWGFDELDQQSIVAFSSDDGGQSWSDTVQISDIQNTGDPGELRSGPLPSAALDGAGKVYVTWSDCRFEANCSANDIVISSSDDGKTWSEVGRIPTVQVGTGIDHVIPGLGIDTDTSGATAHMVLTYYYFSDANCDTDACELNVASVTSIDAGQHWSAPTTLAGPMKPSWLPTTSQGAMVGDYISTAVSGGMGFSVFAVAQAPSGTDFDQSMYVPTTGLKIVGGVNPLEFKSTLKMAMDKAAKSSSKNHHAVYKTAR